MGLSYCKQNLCVDKFCDSKVPQDRDQLIELPNGHEGSLVNVPKDKDDINQIVIRQYSESGNKANETLTNSQKQQTNKKVKFKHRNTMGPSRINSNSSKLNNSFSQAAYDVF